MTNPFKTQKVSGTSTEKDNLVGTLKAADADLVFRIVGGDRYKWNGSAWEQISTAGAAHVTTMPGGIVHIREQDTLSTAVTFDFSATPIIACELDFSMEAATTPDVNSVAFCIDPPNAATRDSWLTAGTNLTGDTQRYTARVKDGKVQLSFTSPVSYIGIKRDLGSDALRVIAVGVGA